MAAKGPKPFQIAVCGLTSSVYMHRSQQGQGAGKSLLCNRFVRPNFDDLLHNHPSVLNHSDYGGTVVNNTHFLYWGEKCVGMDNGEEVKIQIIEHTEFIDDATLKPFSNPKPYYKRCAQLKIQSGGKVAYIHPDQLSLPENFKEAGGFPDKFIVDGFLVCVDVSCENTEMEAEFVDNLLTSLVALKKPLVVAFTKYDIAKPNSLQAMQEVLSNMKKAPATVEVSALKGVNVDLPFLLLAHLIDSKKSGSRLVTYAIAKQHYDDRISSSERSFQELLDRELTDFALPLEPALAKFSSTPEYRLVVELCGSKRVSKLVQAKLNYAKKIQVQRLMEDFLGRIQRLLPELLPDLELEATPDRCREKLKQLGSFTTYFCEEKNWEENVPFLARAMPLIPFGLLSESRATDLIRAHIDKTLLVKRQKLAYDKLRSTLASAQQLRPGTDMDLLFKTLGVEQEASLQTREVLSQLYREKMTEVEGECIKDFEELLLERTDLFVPGEDTTPDIVNEKLKDCPSFQRFEFQPKARQSILVKFISHLEFVDKGPYSKSHLTPFLEGSNLGKDVLYQSKHWAYDNSDTYVNVAILARQEQSAMYLQNDIKTHCSTTAGTLELDGYTYRPEMATFCGDITKLKSEEFVPQCAILIATSSQCVDWMESIAKSLFSPGCSYRGMPVIILALDYSFGEGSPSLPHKDSTPDNDFYKKVKGVANVLQCVVVAEKPTPFLSQRLVMASQVEPLLRALVNSIIQCQEIINHQPTITPKGFNIAVCALPDSSYLPEEAMSPLVNHQLVCYDNAVLYARIAIEKQHRTCSYTFHSTFNVADIKSVPRIGYILIYSTSRRATLSALRWLKPQLYGIPTLVLAIRGEGPLDNQLLEEGQEYAERNGCLFLTSEHWKVGCTANFFNKCWFSRLSTWKAQCPSDELKRKERGAMPLPELRPLPELPPGSNSLASIPVAVGPVPEFTKHSPALPVREDSYSEEEVMSPNLLSPTHSHSTLPHSPSRPTFIPSSVSEGESIYSNPQEMGSKESTLQRKKRKSYVPPIQVLEEPGAESEYSTVVDHAKPKPPGGSRRSSDSIELKSPEEDQRSLGVGDRTSLPGKSPDIAKRTQGRPLPMPAPPRATTPTAEEEYATVRSPVKDEVFRRSESPAHSSEEHIQVVGRNISKMRSPAVSPMSSPVVTRRTPQRDSATPQAPQVPQAPQAPQVPQAPQAPQVPQAPQDTEYAEINVKRKASLPDLDSSPTHKSGSTARDAESLKGKVLLPPEGGSGSLARSPKVAQKVPAKATTPPKAAPPPTKPKPKPDSEVRDMYAVVQPKPKKPSGGEGDQVPLIGKSLKTDRLEQDVEEEVGGAEGGDKTYAQVQKKPKGTTSQATSSKPPVALVRDTPDEEEGGDSTYAQVQKKPKGTTSQATSSKPPVALVRDTPDEEEGGDSTYAQVQKKPKKPLPGSSNPGPTDNPVSSFSKTPSKDRLEQGTEEGGGDGMYAEVKTKAGGVAPPHDHTSLVKRVLKKMPSVPRYDHLSMYDHLPSDDPQGAEIEREQSPGSEPMSPRQPEVEGMPIYATTVPKKKKPPPPPITKPKPHLLEGGPLSPKRDDKALLLAEGSDDESDEIPEIPSRNYNPEDIEGDVPPPLPPRLYSFSDIEDNDEEVISDNEQDIQTISTTEQMALYASVCQQYQKSLSNRATTSDSQEHEQFTAVYDTLENVAAQAKGGVAKSTPQATSHGSAAAVLPGIPPETTFTPQQLKVIKQQQKLLAQLQKKMDKEQQRRWRQEEKRRQKEEEEKEKKKGKGKRRTKKGKQERVRYFGSSLEQVAGEDGVPVFVKRCAAYVEEKGLKVEGIYRISGKKEDVLSLQDKFDEDNNMTFDPQQYCEAAVSSALKAFFKLLPLPLILDTVAVKLLAIAGQSAMDLAEQQVKTQEVLMTLPKCNINTLHFLINHLHVVQQHADRNKMNASNLAIVFWPTLMRPPILDLADPSKQMGWQLAMMRIIEHPEFVPCV